MSGAWGWVGLAVYIFAYDTWALLHDRETLSGAFGRAVAHPLRRWPVVALWGGTTLHLFSRLPFDPLHGYASAVRSRATRRTFLAFLPAEE